MTKRYLPLFLFFLLLHYITAAQTAGTANALFDNGTWFNNNNTGYAFQQNKASNSSPFAATGYAADKIFENKMAAYREQAALYAPHTGTEYDVKYYRLELRINPDTAAGKYIKGKVTTYFTTTIPNFTIANFDFGTPLICDSVYYHGAKLAVGDITRPTDLLQITLPVIATIGTLDSIAVYYQGVPAYVPDFGGGTGYVKAIHNGTHNYIYTLSEPYSSYTWWPCKSFVVNDKADSADVIVSTPTGFKTAGNGTLVSETTIGSNIITYWKERYPIAAYQVCTAVANYDVYPAAATTVNIGGTSMPFYNYIFPETNTPTAQATLDRTKLMLTTFSSKFGDYPFKKEKYGHYTFGFGGGMEHNTFSGMHPSTYDDAGDWDIIAHELGHQWFGAGVTCGSWKDIWINESFATFTEAVCAEFAPSVSVGQTGASWRGHHKSLAINTGYQTQSVYVSDTSSITSIFTPAVYVYERGAMVLYMLRTLLGDAKFFAAIQNYGADPLLQYGNATTADVERHMEAASGLNLTTFFNNWIYNTGFAEYNAAQWNNAGKQIILKLPQAAKYSALTHFDMPVPVRIQGSTGDTTIIVYDNNGIIYYDNDGVLTSTGSDMVQYNLSFVPTTITFDAFNQVLANGSFTKNPALSILAASIVNFKGTRVNSHADLVWVVDKGIAYTSFEVERSTDGISFENIGTVSSRYVSDKTDFTFTDKNIFPGTNYYRIKAVKKEGAFAYTKTITISATTNAAAYTITPNPARDHIFIKGNTVTEKVDVSIYDAAGKLVKRLLKQTLAANNFLKIDVQDMVAGNYFVEIHSGSKGSLTKQIVLLK